MNYENQYYLIPHWLSNLKFFEQRKFFSDSAARSRRTTRPTLLATPMATFTSGSKWISTRTSHICWSMCINWTKENSTYCREQLWNSCKPVQWKPGATMNLSPYFPRLLSEMGEYRVTKTHVMLTRIGEFRENWRRKSRLFRMSADEMTLITSVPWNRLTVGSYSLDQVSSHRGAHNLKSC